jgi:hypothetical protein
MIDRATAAELLDFSTRIGAGQRAEEQLDGAVALHNLLCQHRVAYLADEVGMGKTYVALGALALFRHFAPHFRVLVLAPRENIQRKWMKEMRNFVANNVRFADLRVKSLDGRPTRELTCCDGLVQFVSEALLDPDRDFFARMTSFSLPASGRETVDPEAARRIRDGLRRHLPWLRQEIFDLRDKQGFKDNIARAICCALPVFDLVIVDEAHNLKHGFAGHVSARNRVLSLAFGHPQGAGDERLFPNYGLRARRVLFLSATPLEDDYRQLWNQLDVFGLGDRFTDLRRADLDEQQKKEVARRFLIRRVTAIQIAGREHTKNLYRREWRSGGVETHDEPIRLTDDRQRLVVALVQKKVAELLGSNRFNNNFQIGMLASFESFLETAKVKRVEDDAANFDNAEQTDDTLEREGVDVGDVNRLARSYRGQFNGEELPHPKMNSVVESLSRAWDSGAKTLIFVRRVASVKELKRKLDAAYDQWLIGRMENELPASLRRRFLQIVTRYRAERAEALDRDTVENTGDTDAEDRGGNDTFFAWFFRGEGPANVVSGANIQQRFGQRSGVYSTFFDDNYVAAALACSPADAAKRFAETVGLESEAMLSELQRRSRRFLTRAKKPARGDRFEAVQAAGIEWLKEVSGPHQRLAGAIWHGRFEASLQLRHADEAPDVGGWLGSRTFFTELRERPELCRRLWPGTLPVDGDAEAVRASFRERELRAQMLAAAARLGHAFIDLYVMTMGRIGSFERRAREAADDDTSDLDVERIHEYLALLEEQMRRPRAERAWRAFDELEDIAAHFQLILDVNEPDAQDAQRCPLARASRLFGQLLGKQQPVGGMAGQINRTLVRQFRMPGYPLVLVTTELLQEGEDLHTFCSAIQHYGISWTPSAMEQRIGRIDRVRSQTDRRLGALECTPDGGQKLQVFFPHLNDTVEVLQVRRVLSRMDTFLRLVHEGFGVSNNRDDRRIDIAREVLTERLPIPSDAAPLRTAFAIHPDALVGEIKALAVMSSHAQTMESRFTQLRETPLPGLQVEWEVEAPRGCLLGTVFLGDRQQPFTLLLQSLGERALLRCISPVGCVSPEQMKEAILASIGNRPVRIGAILTKEQRTYDLTVEEDVLLAPEPATDAQRTAMLLRRVVEEADRLEHEHLGRDERIDTFRHELIKESADEI